MEKEKGLRTVVAVNNNFHIGKDGGMLWRCSADLKHFKALTEGFKCLVGNTTAKGLPPLKNRELLIVGHDENCLTLDEALAKTPDWIIGGSSIYKQTLHLCTELHISHINDNSVGDTAFEIPTDFAGEIFHYWFEPNYKLNADDKK